MGSEGTEVKYCVIRFFWSSGRLPEILEFDLKFLHLLFVCNAFGFSFGIRNLKSGRD